MPRTAFTATTTTVGSTGTVLPALGAVDQPNGNSFPNPTGRALIEITNGAGAPITVTFTTGATYNVGSVTYSVIDPPITVTNGTSKVVGPFDKALFNDASNNVLVDWSSGTTITARIIELGAG